jgi:hypothetical protein
LGKGLQKAGSIEYQQILTNALGLLISLPEDQQVNLREKINHILNPGQVNVDSNSPSESITTEPKLIQIPTKSGTPNPILGLYNTYDKKLGPPHIRAIARAAPLCWAYNIDLALFNFPINNLKELVDRVIKDTSVGHGGAYLEQLYKNKRLNIYRSLKNKNWDNLIATTSNPDPNKMINPDNLSNIHGEKCFILGVGKVGLPKDILDCSKHHLEFTGTGVSLETCSAMGVLAHILHSQKRVHK